MPNSSVRIHRTYHPNLINGTKVNKNNSMPPSFAGYNIFSAPGIALLFISSLLGYKSFKKWKAGGVVSKQLLDRTDFKKDVVIVTGANSGIGFETAKQMALLNARVIITCRDDKKVRDTVEELNKLVEIESKMFGKEKNHGTVEGIVMELSSFKSVKRAGSQLLALIGNDRLAVFLMNAGVVTEERKQTEDGFEFMFQVNYLGHFLLTQILMNKILKDGTRVVQVSSRAHTRYPNMKIKYDELHASVANTSIASQYEWYSHSKLAQVLFTRSLHRLFKEKNSSATAVALHPGVVSTSLFRSLPPLFQLLIDTLSRISAKTSIEGAQTSIHCCIDDEIKSGEYYSDCISAERHPLSYNDNAVDELYEKSMEWVFDYL